MNYREEVSFFIEYHGPRDRTDKEFDDSRVKGPRPPYRYLFYEPIPSEDFRPERFPAGCTAFQIRKETQVFVDDQYSTSRYSDVTEKIPVENPIQEPVASFFE